MGHRYLKSTLIPVARYLATKNVRQKLRLKNKEGQLLPPLQVAFLKGEGILRIQFFTLLEKHYFTDYQRQLELWEKMVINRGYILDFLQRIKIDQYIEEGHQQLEDGAFKLYCILLDTLQQSQETTLLKIATTDLFNHHIRSIYPSKSVTQKKNPQNLRHSTLIRLRKYWGASAQLKESFQVQPDRVEFQLRIKLKGYSWHVLIEVNSSRLKLAKIQAYEQLLEGLKEGEYRPENIKLKSLLPVVSRNK